MSWRIWNVFYGQVIKVRKTKFYDFLKIDYRKFSRENKGYKYILVIIDSFSRFAHTVPLKFKTAEETAEAIDSVFSKFHDLPIFFTSDKGNEEGI